MLGLVSQINDNLQDVHGKKPVDVKRKIIRGLGFLVEQIGESINNASLQVRIVSLICSVVQRGL
jgi:serine/threonine-protein kinase ATR